MSALTTPAKNVTDVTVETLPDIRMPRMQGVRTHPQLGPEWCKKHSPTLHADYQAGLL